MKRKTRPNNTVEINTILCECGKEHAFKVNRKNLKLKVTTDPRKFPFAAKANPAGEVLVVVTGVEGMDGPIQLFKGDTLDVNMDQYSLATRKKRKA